MQRAIEIVQRAIDEDVKQNYAEAYKGYQNALDYFMLAMKCTSTHVMLHL
jgi:vacuolar protein-sorting-associated protein 4